MQFKNYIQKSTLSHVLILIMTSQIWSVMGWVKIQKSEFLENGSHFFFEIKELLTSASDDTFSEVVFF